MQNNLYFSFTFYGCDYSICTFLLIFFWQYHPWIKPEVHENKGNDPLLKKLLIVKQILLISTKEV